MLPELVAPTSVSGALHQYAELTRELHDLADSLCMMDQNRSVTWHSAWEQSYEDTVTGKGRTADHAVAHVDRELMVIKTDLRVIDARLRFLDVWLKYQVA